MHKEAVMSIKKKVLAFILPISIFIFGGIGVLFYINKDMTPGSVSDLSRKQIQETYGRSIGTVDFFAKADGAKGFGGQKRRRAFL